MKRKGIPIGLGLLSLLCWLGPLGSAVWALSWSQVTSWLGREVEDGGRGSTGGPRPGFGLCLLSPGNEGIIWNPSPTFIWQGLTRTVGVTPGEAEAVLWRVDAPETASAVFEVPSPGPALEYGQRYQWLFFLTSNQASNEPTATFNFQVVDQATHQVIAADLATLATQLEAEGADREAIAMARVNYFLEHKLPTDAVQELFAVSEPSDELVQAREALVTEVCAEDPPPAPDPVL